MDHQDGFLEGEQNLQQHPHIQQLKAIENLLQHHMPDTVQELKSAGVSPLTSVPTLRVSAARSKHSNKGQKPESICNRQQAGVSQRSICNRHQTGVTSRITYATSTRRSHKPTNSYDKNLWTPIWEDCFCRPQKETQKVGSPPTQHLDQVPTTSGTCLLSAQLVATFQLQFLMFTFSRYTSLLKAEGYSGADACASE